MMDIPGLNASNVQGLNAYQTERAKQDNPLEQVGMSFQEALDSLGETQANSDNLLQQLAAGEDVDLHTVMIATEETDINFRIAMAIRDRLVDAYREVMRMSV
jgi:flagellar hook-basal body complex protein FliE